MADRVWTKQQSDAISARRGTVLVSAAAGSGKTSVLVQRVIERLTDKENPIPADKLLVVTFTKAAAAEMKERVESAIFGLLQSDPENKALRRQQGLIARMNISTVDSFCSKLVKEYFYLLDIAPDFKIIADKQREELMDEAVRGAVDQAFESGMYELADAFSTERNDDRLHELVIKLYEFTGSHLMPERWLSEKLNLYGNNALPGRTPWGQTLLDYAGQILNFCNRLTADSIKAMQVDVAIKAAYAPVFTDDLSLVVSLQKNLACGDWDGFSSALSTATFGRLSTLRGYADDPLKNRLTASRDTVKDSVKKLALIFADSAETCREEIGRMYPVVCKLTEIVTAFSARYAEKKRERKLADYSDLEHWAIKLLLAEEGGVVTPTHTAREIAERFEEIMVDEYQDTNEVQDWIFRAISKNDSNKFMVGDVKQCIYSFRQAMPDIFVQYKESFERYDKEKDAYPATIVLDKNYRSRDTVVATVNFVFSQLMSKTAGGIDYGGDEQLVMGAVYPEKSGCETRVDFLEKDRDIPQELSEARHIAGLIRDMVQGGFTVSDKGGERPATYRDFCILLRSANKYAYAYAKELEQLSVPAWAAVSEGFFASTEVAEVIAFLQVIDNPNQDIPLLSVLMGPVYGFTPDDLAALRIKNRKEPLYLSIIRQEKFAPLLSDLEQYRLMAAVLPSDALIEYLYGRTGFLNLALSMENGESRLYNLRRLQEYARDYESAGYIGISGFVRFIERLKSKKSDMESANLISETADVVRVMSIHKSKGLEFPVCIVAGCGRRMNFETGDVVLSSQLGFGIKLKDEETGAKFTNIVRDAVSLQNNMDMLSEELRVLYVAMTRAKEKLVMVSTVSGVDKALARLSAQITEEGIIEPYAVKSVSAMSEWLMLCALRHPSGKYLRDRIGAEETLVLRENFTPWEIGVFAANGAQPQAEITTEKLVLPDADLFAELQKKLSFQYPNAGISAIPAKVTASALSEEEGGRVQTLPRPGFLSVAGLTPAERGIALHSYMQFSDFKSASRAPEAERDRLVREGFITAEEGAAVQMDKVKAFFESPIGRRIAASGEIIKEQRFTVNIPSKMVKPDLPAELQEIPIILQGAVDCAFVENGKLMIVDFKTDRMDSDEELSLAYGVQLTLYAAALRQVKNMDIGGCYLYSLYTNRAVKVQ